MGVIGVTSANYLASAGHDVTAIDRQPGAALETSFANAGEISPGYASPWAAPGIPQKAVKWLFLKHAPLIIRPRADTMNARRRDLMPICRLVTPNLIELARLNGSTPAPDEEAARLQGEEPSRAIGAAVLVKGGHARDDRAVDILLRPDRPARRFAATRLPGDMRGTGCMLSSAIAASLALGASLEESVRRAKRYVFDALAGRRDRRNTGHRLRVRPPRPVDKYSAWV